LVGKTGHVEDILDERFIHLAKEIVALESSEPLNPTDIAVVTAGRSLGVVKITHDVLVVRSAQLCVVDIRRKTIEFGWS
jgi:hypothetical protein